MDFRIFRNYGMVPGLDMAHSLNGYVYHTKYDTYINLERRTWQTTGENVLALTWALANAPELKSPEDYAEGHTVFYDYLGWFMIFYTEDTGVTLNITISVCAIVVILASVFLMTPAFDADTVTRVGICFVTILGVQIATVAAAVGLTLLIAVTIDAIGASVLVLGDLANIWPLLLSNVLYNDISTGSLLTLDQEEYQHAT